MANARESPRWRGFSNAEWAHLQSASEEMFIAHGHMDWVGLADDIKNGRPIDGACWQCKRPRFLGYALGYVIETSQESNNEPLSDFDRARRRMAAAYSALFELEQRLRIFIQSRLEELYRADWWDKVNENARTQIETRENDPLKRLFDDYSPSKLALADFDGLRLTIIDNWSDFRHVFGNHELFLAQMIWLSKARNRIAHVNTLSEDDASEFIRLANQLLKLLGQIAQPQ